MTNHSSVVQCMVQIQVLLCAKFTEAMRPRLLLSRFLSLRLQLSSARPSVPSTVLTLCCGSTCGA